MPRQGSRRNVPAADDAHRGLIRNSRLFGHPGDFAFSPVWSASSRKADVADNRGVGLGEHGYDAPAVRHFFLGVDIRSSVFGTAE